MTWLASRAEPEPLCVWEGLPYICISWHVTTRSMHVSQLLCVRARYHAHSIAGKTWAQLRLDVGGTTREPH